MDPTFHHWHFRDLFRPDCIHIVFIKIRFSKPLSTKRMNKAASRRDCLRQNGGREYAVSGMPNQKERQLEETNPCDQ